MVNAFSNAVICAIEFLYPAGVSHSADLAAIPDGSTFIASLGFSYFELP